MADMPETFEQCCNIAAASFKSAPEVLFDIEEQVWEPYSIGSAALYAISRMTAHEQMELLATCASEVPDGAGEVMSQKLAYDSLARRISRTLLETPEIFNRARSNSRKAGFINAAAYN